MPVSTNIKTACAVLNSRRQRRDAEVSEEIGDFASEVAEVARMCKIPDNEVLYMTTGMRSFYKRPCSTVFTELGPSYMHEKTHQHWYHVGQNYQHAASWAVQQSGGVHEAQQQTGTHPCNMHLQLQQQLVQRLAGGSEHMLDSSRESGSLQTEGSNTSCYDKLLNLWQEDSHTSSSMSIATEFNHGFDSEGGKPVT